MTNRSTPTGSGGKATRMGLNVLAKSMHRRPNAWRDTTPKPANTTVTPCFTPGTLIETARGQQPVESLHVGDKILTRDNGLQPIVWVGSKHFSGRDLAANPHLKPVLIRQGAFGNGLPERDMRLSPNHRVLVSSEQTALYFKEREVLVSAKHLINNRGVFEVHSLGTTYIHFMFDRHEVVLSNGSWSESFQPADRSLKGIGNAQRNEILELFPKLRSKSGTYVFPTARRTLKRTELDHLID